MAGTGAIVTLRAKHGVRGGLSFRVAARRGTSTFALRAERAVVAAAGGRLYRIGAWLRTDVPGLTVCLRIQEMSPGDSLTPVRTSETCLAPTAKWQHLRLYRRTLARGNRLVFSIYSYGAVASDSFEIDRFRVARRVNVGTKLRWKRVRAAFADAPELG